MVTGPASLAIEKTFMKDEKNHWTLEENKDRTKIRKEDQAILLSLMLALSPTPC